MRRFLSKLRQDVERLRRHLAAVGAGTGDDPRGVNVYVTGAADQLRPDELPPESTAAQRRVVTQVCAMDATIPQFAPDVPGICDYPLPPFSTEN